MRRILILGLSIFLFTCFCVQSWAQVIDASAEIRTIAGGYVGDGGLATGAGLSQLYGVAVDASGNTYIVDTYNHRIRKIATNGIITTMAGNGTSGYSGDGGPATNAQLYFPNGVAVDASGNLYIADSRNNVVRKVATDGTITTVAGNGTAGYSGDGGPAVSAELSYPNAVVVDSSGNLFVADGNNNVVRKVALDGTITTFAGGGSSGLGDGGPATSAQLNFPSGLAFDASGNLYIADNYDALIRKVATDGTITTFAGGGSSGLGDGGPATSAQLCSPTGVAFDVNGNLYLVDSCDSRVRKVATDGTITTIAGNGTWGYSGDNGPATDAELNYPSGVAIDPAGNLYIADTFNLRVRRVATDGTITTIAGSTDSGDGRPATSAVLNLPHGVAADANGNIYFADSLDSVVRKVATNGAITTVAGNGTSGCSGDGGPATSAELRYPWGLAVDDSGNLYIGDESCPVVRKVATDGTITTVAGNGTTGYTGDSGPATSAELGSPTALAVDATGNLYIGDTYDQVVRKVATDGTITTVVTNVLPNGVAVDTLGNLYVADWSGRILKVTPEGAITTVAGNGFWGYSGDGGPATSAQLKAPEAVAADLSGNLFIADRGNQRIRKVDAAGIITTVAGNGFSGYSGDGGLATSAELFQPRGVAVDSAGNVYIADDDNNRIREVLPNEIFGAGFEVIP